MIAAIAAIQQAIKYNAGPLTIHTDSKYVFTHGTARDKKLSKNLKADNVDDIRLLHSLCDQHKVEWVCLSLFLCH